MMHVKSYIILSIRFTRMYIFLSYSVWEQDKQ